MKYNKKRRSPTKLTHPMSERTSYYEQGYGYDQQTEQGIQGAYGSQGESDWNNSYTFYDAPILQPIRVHKRKKNNK